MKQAIRAIAQITGKGKPIESVGTNRNYINCLKLVALHFNQNHGLNLNQITPELATQYLELKAKTVQQKTLDQYRQAIQVMMQHSTKQLSPNKTLPIFIGCKSKSG